MSPDSWCCTRVRNNRYHIHAYASAIHIHKKYGRQGNGPGFLGKKVVILPWKRSLSRKAVKGDKHYLMKTQLVLRSFQPRISSALPLCDAESSKYTIEGENGFLE